MSKTVYDETLCPIDRAASVVADRWVILILRELQMGNDRFDGIQAQTGMSSALLAQRLDMLEQHGLIARRLYQERPRRYAYEPTDKARELDGILLQLRLWGMRHTGLDPHGESAVTMTHRATGKLIDADWQGSDGDGPFSFRQTESRINPGWGAERAARQEAFADTKRQRLAKRAKAQPRD